MYLDRSRKSLLVGVAFLALSAFTIAACGSSGSTNTGGTTAAATATCPPNPFKTTTGILQSINGTSLVVRSTQGSSVQASYATTTRFQQEATTTTSALKEGIAVTVAVTQDSNGNYTATSITLVAGRTGTGGAGTGGTGGAGGFGGGGFGGRNGTPGTFGGRNGTPGTFGGRNASCFRQGAAGGAGAGAAGGTTNGRGLTGTVGQLSGNSLTITDFQGSNYVVTLNAATKIIQFQSATASALKNGANLTITGADNGKGVITAQSITILLAGTTPATTA